MTRRPLGIRAAIFRDTRRSSGCWNRMTQPTLGDYSPTMGRFIEMDPIGFEAGDNNWYRFVANVPTLNTDSSGLIPGDPLSLDGSILAFVNAGWSANEIALTAGITVAAAEAYIYRAEIARGAKNVITSLTATAAAAHSGDPCAAATAARKAAEKSIRSMEKRIAEHYEKIADPLKYMTHPYPQLTQQHNIAIAVADWTKHIVGLQKSVDTYRIALVALKKAEYTACFCWLKPWTWL